MARINNRDKYPQDAEVTAEDFLTGSDHRTGQTKTYKISSILALGGNPPVGDTAASLSGNTITFPDGQTIQIPTDTDTNTFATINSGIITFASGDTVNLGSIDTDTFATLSNDILTLADGSTYNLADTAATLAGSVITFPTGQTITIPNPSTDDQVASEVPVQTSNFNGNLRPTDNTVQKALDRIDDLDISANNNYTIDVIGDTVNLLSNGTIISSDTLTTLASSITNTSTGNTIATHISGSGIQTDIAESITRLNINANILEYIREDGNVDTVDLSNILAGKEDVPNKQTDLLSTNPEHYPNVIAVNNEVKRAFTKKTPVLNGRSFYSGVLPSLSANNHISFPKDKGGLISLYKPHQDSLNEDDKFELLTREKGVYLLSLEFNSGLVIRYKVDTSTVEVRDNHYLYTDVEIIDIPAELVDGSTQTSNNSNPFKSVTLQLLSKARSASLYIDSLQNIDKEGEYLLTTTENDDLIPTNVVRADNTSSSLDLQEILSLNNHEINRFIAPVSYLKVKTIATDYFNYVDDYFNTLLPPSSFTEGNWNLYLTDTTTNADGDLWYVRNYSIFNGGFEFTHSITVVRDFDNFTTSEIPTSNPIELNKEGIVIVRTDNRNVRTYSISLGDGSVFFNGDWDIFQNNVERKGFLISEIKTPNDKLVGTYINKGLRDKVINIDKEFIKDSPLVNFNLEKVNSEIKGSYSLVVRSVNYEDAQWEGDNLLLNLGTSSSFRVNDSSNFESEVTVKVFNAQGITDVNASLGYVNSQSVFISDPSGVISQNNPAVKYIVTIDITERKESQIRGDAPNASAYYHVGNNVLLSDGGSNGHDLFMEGVFNAAHPNHEFTIFKGNFDNGAMPIEAKRVGAQLVYRAIGGQSLDSRFFNADVPYISAHFDNDDNQDDGISDDGKEFHQNAILVRGGVLGEDATTATSSYGKGVEFVEPSRFDDVEPELRDRIVANIAGTGQSLGNSEHSQSPATAIFAGKFKRILDETRVNWKIARKAARLSATKLSNEWNEFDGFGILDVDACIALIEQWKLDGLTKQIADTTEKRLHVPEMLNYEDLYENTAVSKRLLEDRVSVYDEEEVYLTLENGFSNWDGGFKRAKATKQGNLVKISGLIRTPSAFTGAFIVITTLPEKYKPLATSIHTALNFSNMIQLRVLSNGQLRIRLDQKISGMDALPNTWLSLENITFTITD